MDNKYFIKCDCRGHGIGINHIYEDGVYIETYLSYWVEGKWNMGFKEKIRYCWHILTTGNVYADMVIVSNDNRKQLIKVLKEIDKPPKEKK